MKHLKLLLQACLLLLPAAFLQAQNVPPCPGPEPPGAENCQSTCVYCFLNGYQGTNNGTPSGGNTVCGQIAIHNDQWFGFTAGTSSITIDLVTSNCQTGDGLQMAVFNQCSDPDALICHPGAGGLGNQTLSLPYDGYVPGKSYFLMIDGWSGDICDYTIVISNGSIIAQPPGTPDSIIGPSNPCRFSNVVYEVPPVANAGYYQWSVPPGASINGQSNNLLIPAPEGHRVTITLGNTNGNICVQAGNACNPPSAQVCKPVIVAPPPTVTLPKLTICNDDSPYTWEYPPYPVLSNPGTYNLSTFLPSADGCDTVLNQIVVIKQPILTNLGLIVLCQGDCFQLDTQSYCQTGLYSAILTSVNGCDSNVVFAINVANTGSAAQINAPQGQMLNCLTTSLELSAALVNNTSRIWKNMAGDTLGNGTSITVTEPGLYTLEVKSTLPGASCTGLDKILIKRNNYPPPVTASGGILDANHPTVQLQGNSILSGMQYQWTGPNGFTSNLKKPIVSVPGFYTLTVTNPQTGCSTSITVEVIQMI
ncbi:MAG TPA: hypothetical protein VK168_10615 [Saprospiraceae bacterium]|nr:hypothetical protein [Saprospiraceae bacterium]